MTSTAMLSAERFATIRPGFRLLACEPAVLPYFVVTASVLLQQHLPVPPLEEFVMRSVNQGLKEIGDIARFLGLSEEVVSAITARLWQADLVDVPATASGRELRLTHAGERSIAELQEVVPSERDVWFAFDRIGWKAAPVSPRDLLQARDVREQGLIEIRPRLVKKPEILDLPVGEIDRAIKESMRSVMIDVSVLSLKRIDRVDQKFLPCELLIYESTDGAEHAFEVVVDGRLRPEIRTAIESIGGLRHLNLDFGRPVYETPSEVQEVMETVSRIEKRVVELDEVTEIRQRAQLIEEKIETSQTVQEHAGAQVIADLQVRHIDTFEHPILLDEALTNAKSRLLIISPWVRRSVVRRAFLDKLFSAARRGVVIHIGYGIDFNASDCDPDAVDSLQKLDRQFKNVSVSCLASTHAKVLIWDNNEITTSFNWLSFRGDSNRTYRQEVGVLLRNQIEAIDSHWDEQRKWIERAREIS